MVNERGRARNTAFQKDGLRANVIPVQSPLNGRASNRHEHTPWACRIQSCKRAQESEPGSPTVKAQRGSAAGYGLCALSGVEQLVGKNGES